MTKAAFLLALIVTAIASLPVHAQPLRVFVSGLGLDTNPCTVTQPCRTFQQAYNTVAANGEIEVLDPAGYGPLTITHGISIQGHGFGAITQTIGYAITISVTTSDPITLNGLILQGASLFGIYITSGPSVQILNSVVRGFQFGISDQSTTNRSNLLIENTIVSDNEMGGIGIQPYGGSVKATLNRITASNNRFGVSVNGASDMTIANSVISNNNLDGLGITGGGVAWLTKTVISGNGIGVDIIADAGGGVVNSYGDNYIADNGTPVLGTLTPVSTQ
jgi:hypothetical protein